MCFIPKYCRLLPFTITICRLCIFEEKNSNYMEGIEISKLKYEICIADFISALSKFVIRKANWTC